MHGNALNLRTLPPLLSRFAVTEQPTLRDSFGGEGGRGKKKRKEEEGEGGGKEKLAVHVSSAALMEHEERVRVMEKGRKMIQENRFEELFAAIFKLELSSPPFSSSSSPPSPSLSSSPPSPLSSSSPSLSKSSPSSSPSSPSEPPFSSPLYSGVIFREHVLSLLLENELEKYFSQLKTERKEGEEGDRKKDLTNFYNMVCDIFLF